MTPHAVLLGLMGEDPESVEVGRLSRVMDEVKSVGEIGLGSQRLKFDLIRDLVSFSRKSGTFMMLNWLELAFEPSSRPSERITIHGIRRKGRYVGY